MASGAGSTSRPRAPKDTNPPIFHSQREIEEETPTRTSKRQRDVAPKKTTFGSIKSMKEFTLRQFLEVCNVNPYLVEKNTGICPNLYFFSKNQEQIFNEIYKVKNFA
jgi:hypothetical protein